MHLSARQGEIARANDPDHDHRPPLKEPVKYTLVWSSDSDCYFWLSVPPAGYRAVGVIVTDEAEEPKVEEVRCVKEDLSKKVVYSSKHRLMRRRLRLSKEATNRYVLVETRTREFSSPWIVSSRLVEARNWSEK
ncbi:uncharacterized protein LOC112086399 [Eutrema salsugineum]|uniref:uncharacterized protein LOC112086399 n=1 Tax=Eutrema salsugineum TaxID=72664 RepID=UPI000CED359A|nr:uncharacterized protein LOC112086399 [Eutrema salsugineum]